MASLAADLIFDLTGDRLPLDPAYPLWRAVVAVLPWLETEAGAGIHPVRGTAAGDGTMLLARRTKLVVRLPATRVGAALALSGRTLAVGDSPLMVGAGRERPLQPSRTLHAEVAAATPDTVEADFLDQIGHLLDELGVAGKPLCGKRRTLTTEGRQIAGFSLVLHDLKAEQSLLVQTAGLGGHRELGFGIFVPYKAISLTED